MSLHDLDAVLPKDDTKSCIFGFPDRPPDTIPPNYPPLDPPECYPYCGNDDWPPPIFPPGPIIPPGIIPPGTDPFVYPTVEFTLHSVARAILYHVFAGHESLLPPYPYPELTVSLELRGDGFTLIPETLMMFSETDPMPNTSRFSYLGGGGNSSDYLFQFEASHILNSQNKGYGAAINTTENFIAKLLFLYPSIDLFQIKIENTDTIAEHGPIGPPGGLGNQVNSDVELEQHFLTDDDHLYISPGQSGYNVTYAGYTIYIWYFKPSASIYIDTVSHDVAAGISPHILVQEL